MARSVQLAPLLLQIRQRSDIGLSSTGFVTDSELTSYVNSSLAELWDLLIASYGDGYAMCKSTLTSTPNVTVYALPNDFYKMQAVDVLVANGPINNVVKVLPYQNSERDLFSNVVATAYTGLWYTNLRYRVVSYGTSGSPSAGLTQSIEFIPAVGPSPYQILLTYMPCAPVLVNSTDSFDGVNGWDEYVINDCIIKVKAKQETDYSFEMNAKQALARRITDMGKNRDAGSPKYIVDGYYDGGSSGFGGAWR